MAKLPGAIQGARIVGERYVRAQRQQNPEGRMPLFDHLRELRNRIVKMALALIAGMIVGFIFFDQAWRVIERPLCHTVVNGHSGCRTAGGRPADLEQPARSVLPAGQGRVHRRSDPVLASCGCTSCGRSSRPVCTPGRSGGGDVFLGTAVPLFLLGNVLAYVSLGRSMHYLLGLTPAGVGNYIQVDLYMSFVMTMLLAFGIALELPLLIVMLNLAGILTHERFRKWRRVLIFVVFLIAGIANPSPDPITMLILGGACVALVEVAELIIWRHDRRQARLHPDPYAGLADDELSPLDLDDTGSRDSHLN